jgi:hypothetical protein
MVLAVSFRTMRPTKELSRRAPWAVFLSAIGCAAVFASLFAACSSSQSSPPIGDDEGGNIPGGGGTTMGGPGAGGSSGEPALPPETEEQRAFEAPRAGARFVYVANAQRDTVAIIDSIGRGIHTVPVGDTPSYLATVPGADVALVINLGTMDVNILRTSSDGVTAVARVPVVAGANRISVGRDGRHALAWFDSSNRDSTAPGNFQEVSLLTLAPGADASVPMTVGFRPSDVVFADDGSAAFVITEDGISIIRFADVKGPAVAPFVRVGDLGAGMPQPLDVGVTPDGRYAVARQEGSPRVLLVDLGQGVATTVDLGAPVTDLDLAASGGFVLAVLRGQNAIVRIPVPAGFTDASARRTRQFPGETVGSASLAPDGKTAVLYTTAATPAVERIVIVDLTSDAPGVPVRLKKAVRAVAIAPDGNTAVVLHTKVAGDPAAPGLDVDAQIDRSYGYTVVNLHTAFPKLQLTPADIAAMAITPDAANAFLVVRDPAATTTVRRVQQIALGSFIVNDIELGSPPVAIAVLAASTKRVFVSQQHPEGRISFIDWETHQVQSVTGFELNGRIVQ